MASFIMAMQINRESKKEHPDVTHQVDDSLEVFRQHKLEVKAVFATLGRYDYLVWFEAEDQREAFKVAAEINDRRTLKTETWPVIPYSDFTELVG